MDGFENAVCESYAVFAAHGRPAYCVGIFAHVNHQEQKEYLMCKVHIGTQSLSALTLAEAARFKNQLGLHHDGSTIKVPFDMDLFNIDVMAKQPFGNRTILLSIGNLTILVNGTDAPHPENKKEPCALSICNCLIPVTSYSIYNLDGFPSIHLLMEPSSIVYKQALAQYNIYHEVTFIFTIDAVEYGLPGTIMQFKNNSENEIAAIIQPYVSLILKSTVKAFAHYESIHPFSLIQYVLGREDLGGVEVKIQDDLPENMTEYLVVKAIKHINIKNETLLLSDVRINYPIDLSESFTEMMIQECKGIPYCFAWTTVMAANHQEAADLATSKIENVMNIMEFMLRSNAIFLEYAMNASTSEWNLSLNNHTHFTLSNCIYIESNLMREKISDGCSLLENASDRLLTPKELRYFDGHPWCFDGLKLAGDKKSAVRSIIQAITWINRAWHEENPFDKVIFANISLEFCLSGETGTTLLEDKLAELKCPADHSCHYINHMIDLVTNDTIAGEILGIDDEKTLHLVVQSIANDVKSALKRPSLKSKLHSLIKRLEIPIHEHDLYLIDQCRKIRNSMVHGRDMDTINTLEFKRICSSISRIIAYKYKWLYEKEVSKNESR